MAIADLRREYKVGNLRRVDLDLDPMAQFRKWFQQAAETKSPGGLLRRIGIATYKWFQIVTGNTTAEANAMMLATADKNGRPAARMVLLKGVDERGFIFFSHYEGPKGRDLDENPQAALVFYWPELERQVCVGGVVSKVPREESEAYFKTRPRGNRLAAWVSRQSEVVTNQQALEEKFQQVAAKYPNDDVPVPPYWGGYVLSPTRIEFWQGRPNRLHDRFRYTKKSAGRWLIERLSP